MVGADLVSNVPSPRPPWLPLADAVPDPGELSNVVAELPVSCIFKGEANPPSTVGFCGSEPGY